MSNSLTNGASTRQRRDPPERTQPHRGVLNAFGKSGMDHRQPTGHPLGPGFGDGDVQAQTQAQAQAQQAFGDDAVRDASELIDRHIQEGVAKDQEAQTTGGGMDAMSWLGGLAQSQDLAGIVSQATKAYSEIATMWVELASAIREQVSQTRGDRAAADTTPQPTGAAPALRLRAATPTEAHVDMLKPGVPVKATPLAADDPDQSARITRVSIADGTLSIVVPSDHPTGVYRGMLMDAGGATLGIVTAEVFAEDAP